MFFLKKVALVFIFFIFSNLYSGNLVKAQKENLSKKGIDINFAYTSDFFSNLSGGIKEKTGYLNNIDLIFSFNFEKSMGLSGLTGKLYFLSNHGDNLTEFMGDIQTASNIESPKGSRIYEAWIQKESKNGKFSVIFGLFDLNSEFDTTETGGFFINSSHGIGPDYSQSGENGPSIFPFTSLALRFRYNFDNNLYLATAIFDGVPGDPNNLHGTHIKIGKEDGYLTTAEFGYLNEETESKLSIGIWNYTKDFENLENSLIKNKSNGFYILGENKLFSESDDNSQGLSAFFRFGFAENKINQVDFYFGGGFVYKGLIPGRNEDTIGLAFANAHLGKPYKNINVIEGLTYENSEFNVELSYSSQITNWFRIQPDIQYVINPGMNPNLKNSFVFILRTEFSF